MPQQSDAPERFLTGQEYTRSDVFTVLRVPDNKQGGDWFTCNVVFGRGRVRKGNSRSYIGFRVAMVPEPGNLTLAALAAVGLCARRCGRLACGR